MIVLDCSAAVEMIRDTEKGRAFRMLLLQGEKKIASELFSAEVCNAFWKYVHAGTLSPDDACSYVEKACALVDEFVPIEENAAEAFNEALRHDHSVYDLLYVTLARRNAATLMTADRKLMQLCERMGVDCVAEVSLAE